MEETGLQRLEKFANMTHKSLNLIRDWEFSHLYMNSNKDNPCGTIGCKLGTLPAAFPNNKLYYFDNDNWTSFQIYEDEIKNFFNLSDEEFLILFFPGVKQISIGTNILSQLSQEASEDDVNNNIKLYIKYKNEKSEG